MSIIVKKIKHHKDNIYYNAVINPIPANGPGASPCTYVENLSQSLIGNPSDYYCSIVRFILPIDSIPTLLFPLDINQDATLTITVSSANATIGATYRDQTGTIYTVTATIVASTTLVVTGNKPLNLNHYPISSSPLTLTKVSGTGDTTITYTSSTAVSDPLLSNLVIGINLGGTYPTPGLTSVPIGGTNYPASVMYKPPSNLPEPPIGDGFYDNNDTINSFYWVYSIVQMIDMFNITLNTAMISAAMPLTYTFTILAANATAGAIYKDVRGNTYSVNTTIVGGLSLVTTGLGTAQAPHGTVLTKVSGTGDATITFSAVVASGITRPYYSYNPDDELITLHVADDFLDTGAKIYINKFMVNYLASFNFYFDNTTFSEGLLHFHNLSQLPIGQSSPYSIVQNYNTISLWFDLRRILILSNTLPVTPEIIPAGTTNGVVSYYPVITDFAVALENANQLQEVLVYSPLAQYRLVDMSGNSALNKIDFSFYWEDRFNNIIPVPLSAYQQASIKIGFFKKSLYNKDPHSW